MKEKFDAYCKAIARLEEALNVPPTSLNLDAAIQRFEFTYELCWKVLKSALKKDGFESNSPRESFKNAFQVDYIKSEAVWLEMIKDRNITTHIYDESEAKKIYQRIKDNYLKEFVALRDKLAKK